MKTGKELRIVFMGTPEFAVASLAALLEKGYNVVGVVTAPDKPAGRGQKLQQSAVKGFALEHNIPVLQPEKLKDENFLHDLQSLNPFRTTGNGQPWINSSCAFIAETNLRMFTTGDSTLSLSHATIAVLNMFFFIKIK